MRARAGQPTSRRDEPGACHGRSPDVSEIGMRSPADRCRACRAACAHEGSPPRARPRPGCRLRDQDRLAQLLVPGPEAQGHALEGGKVEIRAEHEAADRPGVGLPEPGHGFADRANGDPRLVIERAHGAIGPATEAVLELGGAPELMGGVPGRRGRAPACRRPGAGPRSGMGCSRRIRRPRRRRSPRRSRRRA